MDSLHHTASLLSEAFADVRCVGRTPLTAAMRAYAVAKLGEMCDLEIVTDQ